MADLEELEKRIDTGSERDRKDHALLLFVLGFLLLVFGVYMVFQSTQVSSSWPWYIGSFSVPTGVIVVPLLIGIGMLFFNSKSAAGWLLTVLGAMFIIVTIIMSVSIHFSTTSLFTFVLMFGSITAGAGMMMRALFRPKNKK